MAIHSPNVFHNTIGAASVYSATGSTPSYEPDTPTAIASDNSTNIIKPKNIISAPSGSEETIKIGAAWLGYYLITFNATAKGGTDKLWLLEPYKDASAIGYGNALFYQNTISAETIPFYEISTTFIVKLQKDEYISFYTSLESEEYAVDFQWLNIQITAYQLEQVGIH